VTEGELRRQLESSKDLLGIQILTGAMAGGVLLFLLVTLALWALGGMDEAPGDRDLSLFPILSGVNAVMFVSCLTAGFVLYRLQTRNVGRAASAAELLAALRGATVLRTSLLEGSALFGIVVCLLGVLQGTVGEQPWIWANAAPAAAFLLFTLATFPTRERVIDLFTLRAASGGMRRPASSRPI
jgi:hypothetical protein